MEFAGFRLLLFASLFLLNSAVDVLFKDRFVEVGDDPCKYLPDGVYPVRDVFKFISCKDHKSTTHICPTKQFFEPGPKKCVDASTQSVKTFCQNRTNGDWLNPWNCHTLFKCFASYTSTIPCQLSTLVYDPDIDQCVYPAKRKCEQLPSENTVAHKVIESSPCDGKKDGNYEIPDVFRYLVCKSGKASYGDCDLNEIFEPGNGRCVSILTQSVFRFCQNRTDGDYRNPWACHRFLSCTKGTTVNKPCPLDWLVYDPDTDYCVPNYPCNQVGVSQDDNPCEVLKDGNYPIRDVFKYMTCKDKKTTYNECEEKEVFEPGTLVCVDASTQSKENFCQNRTNGDWSDPWDCHQFFKCFYKQAYEYQCQTKELVYNPNTDACVYSKQYECKQLKQQQKLLSKTVLRSTVTADDFCKGRSDGNYAVPDVFSYITCSKEKSSRKSCAKPTIFSQKAGKCEEPGTLVGFCEDRTDRDWRNPWNCYSAINCQSKRSKVIPCLINGFVFDPDLDVCKKTYPCDKLSTAVKSFIDPELNCNKKPDGDYSIRDVMRYLRCTKQVATVMKCKEGYVFEKLLGGCINETRVAAESFCINQADGNYRDPWNCHGYISCVNGRSHQRQCAIDTLVYNPYTDRCQYASHDWKCFQYNDVLNKRHNVQEKCPPKLSSLNVPSPNAPVHVPQIKDICTTLDNGLYAIRNVLQYLECNNHTSKTVDCPKGTIYIPGESNCTNATKVTKDNFCSKRSEGNWLNPWDCHTYVTCRFQHPIQISKCNLFVTLNYDPIQDVCDYPSVVPCVEIAKSSEEIVETALLTEVTTPAVTADDFCKGKSDGKYPVPDVLRYIQCKGGKSTQGTCPTGDIFSQQSNDCVSIATQSFTQFCRGRDANVDWRNPWDCTSYIVCLSGSSRKRKCLINGFVFDPRNDVCVKPSVFSCINIGTASQYDGKKTKKVQALKKTSVLERLDIPHVKDICTYTDDGIYGIRNVLQYLECKNHTSIIHDCVKGFIYVSGNNCTNATKYHEDNFCIGRGEGNWANPWDCHTYFSCHADTTFKRVCNNFVTLNYDAVLDVCEYPTQQKCVQLESSTKQLLIAPHTSIVSSTDPCVKLPDGYYAERDVTKYIYCHHGHSHNGQCKTGAIFVPGVNRCTPIKKVDPEKFCVNRTDGNYQNPWNCHHYFTCHVERTFDRPCSNMTILNYDPKLDLCDFPYERKCVNVTSNSLESFRRIPVLKLRRINASPCADLDNGNYPLRDVFMYMQCKNQQGTIKSCKAETYFDVSKKECIRSESKIDATSFCRGRDTGNWGNPWNCHHYITCTALKGFDRPCSLATKLIYNPHKNLCEYADKHLCKQLPSIDSKSTTSIEDVIANDRIIL